MRPTGRDNRLWTLLLIVAGLLVVIPVVLFLLSGTIRSRLFPAAVIPSITPLTANRTTIGPSPTAAAQPTPVRTSKPGSTLSPTSPIQPNLAQNAGASWSLVFSDDFNNGHLNLNKWVTCYWWENNGCTNSGNDELEWYLPGNIQFDNQSVKLVAETQPRGIQATDGHTYPYSSGMITTGRSTNNLSDPVKFSFKYGFAEIRAKVPGGQGLWPAFWMLPTNNSDQPEIDVMEIIGGDPYTVNMSIHYASQPDGAIVKEGYAWKGTQDLSQDWHTYGVDWEPTYVAWYVDGVERWRYTNQSHIPNEPMYLLQNLAVGGDWPGSPNSTTVFPSDFQIDYARVWQR